LVFQGDPPSLPLRCDVPMFKACPFKVAGPDGAELDSRGTVNCPWCGRRHVHGSLNQSLCKEWHLFKQVHKENQKAMPGGRKYFLHGCRAEVFSPMCDAATRRMLWPKVHITILRRDGFTCQDCGRYGRRLIDGRIRGQEVHHIVPRSEGGTEHPANLKTLCHQCHKRYTADSAVERAELRRSEGISSELSQHALALETMAQDEELSERMDLRFQD
jgi:uncharacterized Zn-finger protein